MRRKLGQHFLVRQRVVERIVRALNLNQEDTVLEIGPGKGAITASLISQVKYCLVVEKDSQLSDFLRAKFAEARNFEIITGDFLEVPWPTLMQKLGPNFKIVSNLPYEAATAILLKILEEAASGTMMTLMFQKEVADRIAAKPCSKDYGSLSVWTQVQAEVKSLFEVPPASFHPPPHVMSEVLIFKIRDISLVPRGSLAEFEKALRAGFGRRRKMLRQNLKSFFAKESASQIEERLSRIGAKPQARAEELSIEQWVQLWNQANR